MAKLKAKVDKKNIVKEKDEDQSNNTDGDTAAENSSEDHAGVKKSGRGKKVPESEAPLESTEVKEENADETEANIVDEQTVVNGSSKTHGGSKTTATNEENTDATEATKGRKRGGKTTAAKTKKAKTDTQDAVENSSQEDKTEDATSDDKSQTVNSTPAKKGKQNKKSASKQQKRKIEESKDDDDYEVEDILEMQTGESGEKLFLVKWKGYKKSDSTWEPEDNLSCKGLIQAFYKRSESGGRTPAKKERTSRSPAKKAKTENQNKQNSRAASKSSPKSPKGQKQQNNAVFEVEEILDVVVKKGKKEFLIKWKGYTKSESSWEPESNLSCKHLIEEFYEKSGKGDDTSKPKQTAKAKGQKNKENNAAAAEEEEYEVEKIVDMKTDKKGKKEFRIRWKGYGEDQDTWETENNLSCKDLIDSFMASNKTEKTPAKAAASKKRASKKKK